MNSPRLSPNRWSGSAVATAVLLLASGAAAGWCFGVATDRGFSHANRSLEGIAFAVSILAFVFALIWWVVAATRGLPGNVVLGATCILYGGLFEVSADRSYMVVLLVFGVVVLGFGLYHERRRRTREQIRTSVRRTGAVTTGRLVALNRGRMSVHDDRGGAVVATVDFADSHGRVQTVRRPLRLPRGTGLPIGTPTTVWYPPDGPAQNWAITVELSEQYPYRIG